MQETLSLKTLKQEIIKNYNSINQEIFGIGVKSQRIEILGDKILIFAIHKRIPALRMLDDRERDLTRIVDRSLIDENKKILAERMEELVGIEVETILKDYDPVTERAVTVIHLKDSLGEEE